MDTTDTLVAFAGLVRAVAGDLPSPSSITVNRGGYVSVQFDTRDALTHWAVYFEAPRTEQVSYETGALHIWADINHDRLTIHAFHVDHSLEQVSA